MSNSSNSIPLDNGGGNIALKAAPISFKQRQNSEATAATESSFISPSDSQSGVNNYNNTGSIKMMSKSFGGGPSAFLSSRITLTPPAPGAVQRYSSASHSSISYSGYLFKRSNFPHQNVDPVRYQQLIVMDDDHEFNYEHGPLHEDTQQYASTTDRQYYVDPSGLPSLPNMPGAFAASDNIHYHPEPFLVSDHPWPDFHSPMAAHVQKQNTQSTPPVAPSMMVGSPTTVAPSQQEEQQQQNKSEDTKNKTTEEKNPFQLGLESAAAFFGIRLGEEGNNKEQHRNRSRIDETVNTKQPILSSLIQPKRPSSSPIKMPGQNTTTTIPLAQPAARRAISIPSESIDSSPASRHQAAYRKESFREANHRRHSAPQEATPPSSELIESSLSFGTHNINSAGGVASPTGIPQDFYDPKDGHLWRAKYCVLEDGVLYFYRNANDGDSMEAAAERKRTHEEEMDGMDRSSPVSGNFGNNSDNPPVVPLTLSSTLSRRRSSAQDLSKSPMIRPTVLHHIDSVSGGSDSSGNPPNCHCMWEKRVFLDCIEEVRTAEQHYGKNSFELTAVTDGESHVDKLVLMAPNLSEMNEWIFQFHRSLASFMRNIMDVFASTSSSGVFLDIHRPSNMLTPAHSSHRTPLQMAGAIPHSPSEKQLQRLMAMSPRFHHHFRGLSGTPIQPTLSHGHGRTSLRRRTTLKRTSSEGASVTSTPDTADADDSPQHQFAFREPSPLQGEPESISPPRQFLIPPPTKGAASTSVGTGSLRGSIVSLDNRHRIPTPTPPPELSEPEFSAPPSEVPEMERPKPATGKYIPPHLRNKQDDGSFALKSSKYVPPHLCNQQEAPVRKYIPPSIRKDVNDIVSSTPPMSSAVMSLAERAQLAPSSPIRRESPVGLTMNSQDNLDVVEKSTTDFVRGGCADPFLIQGSVLDEMYIPRKASRVKKASTEAFGSFGGERLDQQNIEFMSASPKSLLRWEIGAVSECGVRDHNEDAFLITNDLLAAFESGPFDQSSQTFWTKEAAFHSTGLFAIFDGHCGNQAARFAVERLAHFIHAELHQIPITEAPFSPERVEAVLHNAITKLDDAFCNVCQEDGREWESGATALVAMIVNDHLVIANVGDCRGVLCRSVLDTASYETSKGWSLLEDLEDEMKESDRNSDAHKSRSCYWKEVTNTHSPASEKEKFRIEKANGWITTDIEIPIAQLRRMDFLDEDVIAIVKRCLHYPNTGNNTSASDSERSTKECKAAPQRILHISRVCGELAVSRALGDRDFKAQFNSLSSQDDGEAAPLDSNDMPWWDCPLFLTYPDDHSRRFRGDLLINTPDFETVKVGENGVSDEFLLLACDGLWDVMDTDDAVRVVRDLLFRKRWTAKRAAARLAELAIHLGSSDNVTVIVLRLFSLEEDDSNM